MARMPKAVEPTPPNTLIASAARIGGANLMNLSRRNTQAGWHTAAWEFYHTIGEFRYACDWAGAMLSKAILFPTMKNSLGVIERVTSGPAVEYIDMLFGDDDGRAEMLRQIGIHMSVTGDLYIVGYQNPDPFGEEEVWQIVAPHRINRPQTDNPDDHYRINGVEVPVPQNEVFCMRLWRPDPEDPEKSISPAAGVLSILGEIARLTDHVAAQVDSRLAGAGILLMPSEMQLPTPPVEDGTIQRTANNAEELMKQISDAMGKAIADRSHASALVPIVITAPGDVIDKVQHITFWSELSEQAMELRKEAIGRLALGMDIPPEVLQGVSEANHWSAWQADESAIKAHTEPLLKMITSGIAQKYLRPLMTEDGEDPDGEVIPGVDKSEVRRYSIGVDTSEMRLRPNRSKEALELYDRGALSREALIRETGFDDQDIMDDEEFKLWMIRKIASGSTTPELVAGAIKALEIDLPVEAVPEEGQEGRPSPSLEDHPVLDIPNREIGQRRRDARQRGDVPSSDIARRSAASEETSRLAAAVAVGSEQAVFRALERAGNRMRNKLGGKLEGVSAAETYLTFGAKTTDLDFYLDDAWGENISALSEHAGVSKATLKAALDGYCRILISNQQPHTFKGLEKHLTMALRPGNQLTRAHEEVMEAS